MIIQGMVVPAFACLDLWYSRSSRVRPFSGVVIVSHDERLVSLVCNEMWIVHNGEVCNGHVDRCGVIVALTRVVCLCDAG